MLSWEFFQFTCKLSWELEYGRQMFLNYLSRLLCLCPTNRMHCRVESQGFGPKRFSTNIFKQMKILIMCQRILPLLFCTTVISGWRKAYKPDTSFLCPPNYSCIENFVYYKVINWKLINTFCMSYTSKPFDLLANIKYKSVYFICLVRIWSAFLEDGTGKSAHYHKMLQDGKLSQFHRNCDSWQTMGRNFQLLSESQIPMKLYHHWCIKQTSENN